VSGRRRNDVAFDVPAEVAFDFLVDPRNRPRWQSSLRRVEDVMPAEPEVGQRWTDVTVPGFRPAMETTVLERPRSWTERGTWGPIAAELTLTFTARHGGCTVRPAFTLSGRGPAGLVARALGALAPYAVRSDLRRAADLLLSEGATGQ
jgi:hypothetical protein